MEHSRFPHNSSNSHPILCTHQSYSSQDPWQATPQVYNTSSQNNTKTDQSQHSTLHRNSTRSNHITHIGTLMGTNLLIIILQCFNITGNCYRDENYIINYLCQLVLHFLVIVYAILYNILLFNNSIQYTSMSQHPHSKEKKLNKTKPIAKQQKPAQQHNTKANKPKDARFKSAEYDPKFMTPSSKIDKVKIDKRFADKLQSEKFRIAGSVDKYGRKQVESNQLAGMSDYYYTQDDPENIKQVPAPNHKNESKPKQQKQKKQKKIQQVQQQMEEDASQEHEREENNISKWMREYNQQSSNQMGDEVDQLVSESDSIWSDDDKNVIKNQSVQVTKRLALCNYDWMNINSKDLMLLFSSFKPAAGTIISVSVYYSQIGKEKMQLEEKFGPQGIWNTKAEEAKSKDKAKSFNSSKIAQEEAFDHKKLRAYEKQRLKYCYAVIECNAKKTADQIYKQCDGNQFESSNLLFDLRFIPDDVKFDPSMLKQRCDEIPVSGEVKNFVNRAMGHSNVSLTWEDPELNETANLKKKNWSKISDKEMNNIDWSLYINEDVQKADDNYNRLIGREKQQEQDVELEENLNVSDWRKQCNKKYKRESADDELQITFPSGFDNKIPQKRQKQSLNKQLKTRKERWRQIQQEKKKRQQIELLVEKSDKKQFVYNPNDDRFKAIVDNPAYHIDPSNPKFDHRKVGAAFAEVVKQNKKKNLL